jgi:hypothetical protein
VWITTVAVALLFAVFCSGDVVAAVEVTVAVPAAVAVAVTVNVAEAPLVSRGMVHVTAGDPLQPADAETNARPGGNVCWTDTLEASRFPAFVTLTVNVTRSPTFADVGAFAEADKSADAGGGVLLTIVVTEVVGMLFKKFAPTTMASA